MSEYSVEATYQPQPLEALIKELPPDLRGEVRDFVEFILAKRKRPAAQPTRHASEDLREPPDSTLGAVLQSEFFGMWRERDDLPDSPEFARSLRQQAWERSS